MEYLDFPTLSNLPIYMCQILQLQASRKWLHGKTTSNSPSYILADFVFIFSQKETVCLKGCFKMQDTDSSGFACLEILDLGFPIV